jgi:hypothetical protein
MRRLRRFVRLGVFRYGAEPDRAISYIVLRQDALLQEKRQLDKVAFLLRLKNAEKLFLYALRHDCGVEALAQFVGYFVKFAALVDFDGLVRRI